MKRHLPLLSFTASLLCLFLYCVTGISGNGGSSETVNAKVYITDTTVFAAADDAQIMTLEAFSADYRPWEKSGYTAVTATGSAVPTLQLPAPGAYNFIVRCNSGTGACFISGVTIAGNSSDSIPCTLGPVCSVQGTLQHSDSLSVYSKYTVAITGTPFALSVKGGRTFSFAGVPQGSYSMTVRPADQRLFIATARYHFSTGTAGGNTVLDIVMP